MIITLHSSCGSKLGCMDVAVKTARQKEQRLFLPIGFYTLVCSTRFKKYRAGCKRSRVIYSLQFKPHYVLMKSNATMACLANATAAARPPYQFNRLKIPWNLTVINKHSFLFTVLIWCHSQQCMIACLLMQAEVAHASAMPPAALLKLLAEHHANLLRSFLLWSYNLLGARFVTLVAG